MLARRRGFALLLLSSVGHSDQLLPCQQNKSGVHSFPHRQPREILTYVPTLPLTWHLAEGPSKWKVIFQVPSHYVRRVLNLFQPKGRDTQ